MCKHLLVGTFNQEKALTSRGLLHDYQPLNKRLKFYCTPQITALNLIGKVVKLIFDDINPKETNFWMKQPCYKTFLSLFVPNLLSMSSLKMNYRKCVVKDARFLVSAFYIKLIAAQLLLM